MALNQAELEALSQSGWEDCLYPWLTAQFAVNPLARFTLRPTWSPGTELDVYIDRGKIQFESKHLPPRRF